MAPILGIFLLFAGIATVLSLQCYETDRNACNMSEKLSFGSLSQLKKCKDAKYYKKECLNLTGPFCMKVVEKMMVVTAEFRSCGYAHMSCVKKSDGNGCFKCDKDLCNDGFLNSEITSNMVPFCIIFITVRLLF